MKLPRLTIRRLMIVVGIVALAFGGLTWAQRVGLWWNISQAFEIGLYFFPIFACVAGTAAIVAPCLAVANLRALRARSLCMLLPFAVPFALLAFGMAFRHTQNDGVAASIVDQRRLIVEWSIWLHVPIGVVLLGCFRSVSAWLIIGCVTVVSVWLSFGAEALSWMSVTNIWL